MEYDRQVAERGWEEPTWFKVYVCMMSGKVIVVDVSSRHTFEQVKFWIWIKEGFVPYQQHLVWGTHEVDDTYRIKETCEVSLIVEDQVYAMYKVLIWSDRLNLDRAGDGIEWVQMMINLATCRRTWGEHGMFTDAELGKLRVMLATHDGWTFAVSLAHTAPGMKDVEGHAEWAREEPTWFNMYVHMMSDKVIVVNAKIVEVDRVYQEVLSSTVHSRMTLFLL
jgi:hypothetical protein